MICETSCSTLLPRQPFMVKCSSMYYKRVINDLGISHFYRFKQADNTNQIETSVPDGCTDIIFQYDASGEDVGVHLYGTPLAPHSIGMKPGYYYFGVRFLPGNFPLTGGLSMADTINMVIPLNFRTGYEDLAEAIGKTEDFQIQIDLFMNYYKKNIEDGAARVKNFTLKKYMVNQIISCNGKLKISELAKMSGYSVRYVNSVFTTEMGIPPKEFCRIIRFQKCLSDMCRGYSGHDRLDLAAMSMDLGYSDESHMIRDFKEFTQRTPLAFLKELSGFHYLNRLKVI